MYHAARGLYVWLQGLPGPTDNGPLSAQIWPCIQGAISSIKNEANAHVYCRSCDKTWDMLLVLLILITGVYFLNNSLFQR